jgi:hypothetical protein
MELNSFSADFSSARVTWDGFFDPWDRELDEPAGPAGEDHEGCKQKRAAQWLPAFKR